MQDAKIEPITVTSVHQRAEKITRILTLVLPALHQAVRKFKTGGDFIGGAPISVEAVITEAIERLDEAAIEAYWLELANLTRIAAPDTDEREARERALKARRAS